MLAYLIIFQKDNIVAGGMVLPINERSRGGRPGNKILTCKKLYHCVITENMLRIIMCVCVCVCVCVQAVTWVCSRWGAVGTLPE